MNVRDWEIGDIVEVDESSLLGNGGEYEKIVSIGSVEYGVDGNYRLKIFTSNIDGRISGWFSDRYKWIGKGELSDWIRVREL